MLSPRRVAKAVDGSKYRCRVIFNIRERPKKIRPFTEESLSHNNRVFSREYPIPVEPVGQALTQRKELKKWQSCPRRPEGRTKSRCSKKAIRGLLPNSNWRFYTFFSICCSKWDWSGASSKTFTPSFHKEHLMDRDYGTLPYIVLSGRKAQITHHSSLR